MKYRKSIRLISLLIASILLIIIALPMIFPQTIVEKAKGLINTSINGKLNFNKIKLSFLNNFPNLTVTIYDFTIMGSAPFELDTLVSGKEISLGVDILSVFGDSTKINSIYLDGVRLNILRGESGSTNYNIFKSDTTVVVKENETSEKPGGAAFDISIIKMKESNFRFYDSSLKLLIEGNNIRYKGKGNFAKAEFDLESDITIGILSFVYDGVKYIDQKNVTAKLSTNINTSSLKFKLLQNKIKFQDISAAFMGELSIYEDGYDIDFDLKTENSNFSDLLSLIPHEYDDWFKNTTFGGSAFLSVLFKGSARDSSAMSPDLDVRLEVKDGKIAYKDAPFPLEKILFKASLQIPGLNFEALELNVDTLDFSVKNGGNHANMQIKGFSEPNIFSNINGSLNLDYLTKSLGLTAFNLTGILDYKATANGVIDLTKKRIPIIDAYIKVSNGTASSSKYAYPVKDLNTEINITSKTGNYSDLKILIEPFSFIFEEKPFTITAKLENFDNLQYDIASNGILNLDNIYKILEIQDATIRGELLTNFKLVGNMEDARNGKYKNLNNSGTLELKNFEYQSGSYKYPLNIPDATLTFDKDKAWLKNAAFHYNRNNVLLNGYAQNFMGYYFDNTDLLGTLSITSDQMFLDDFTSIFEETTAKEPTTANATSAPLSEGVIEIPPHLNLSLSADIKGIEYGTIKASDFSGEVTIKDRSVELKNTKISLAGAKFRLDASYKPLGKESAEFNFKVKADSFDIRRAYNEIPIFKELVTSAASMNGKISTEYTLKGKLNKNMKPVYPSVKGSGFIKMEDVSVVGLKVLGAISKATGKDSISNPNLKAVLIKTTIANNLITIEQTNMKIFGFRPRFEGQVSLDGKLNINFRLGLPPFGLIRIPMTITGTMDNPIVNMRKGKEGDKLEEELDK